MSFEYPDQRKSFYPERESFGVEEELEQLEKIQKGEMKKYELSDSEKKEFFNFENSLYEGLKEYYEITIVENSFYTEYFETEEGINDFENTTGIAIKERKISDIREFLIKTRHKLSLTDSSKIKDLSGRSKLYSENKLLEDLLKNINNEYELSISNCKIPKRITLLKNPNEALQKLLGLRNFKKKLKEEYIEISSKNSDSDFIIAKKEIIDLYTQKINGIIASNYHLGVLLSQIEEEFDLEELSEEERELLLLNRGLSSQEKNFSRMDKYLYGSSRETQNGMTKQVGSELVEMAEDFRNEIVENEVGKYAKIRERGLDPGKVLQRSISVEQYSVWAEEMLEKYNLKSSQSPVEFTPSRKGPAPDGKWQFVARDSYKTMSVNGKQRVIKSGSKNKSIDECVAVLLGHEMEHVFQYESQSKIPLKLFSELNGAGRSEVFAEMGAMLLESKINSEIFGYKSLPHPHYVVAMAKRLEGGNYLECVKAFYDSALIILRKAREMGDLTEEEFRNESRRKLEIAIDRVKRLYRSGVALDAKTKFLAKSKDTVYLEQYTLMEKLKERGLEKAAYIAGANFRSQIFLSKLGFLDYSKMELPLYAFEIWEREKNKYMLEK